MRKLSRAAQRISSRKRSRVEDITEALWGSKVSPATISELNKKAYVHSEDWRNRPLQGGRYPYVYVDGIYLRRNWGAEYENVAILVAIAANEDGFREVLGAAEGMKEDKASWVSFFQLTYCDFPSEHWARIRTNNVIERLNREIRRRTCMVGTFPDGNSALMLVCAQLRHDHPLKGLVRCGNCKRAMTRRKNTEGAPRVCFVRLQRAKRAGRSDIPSPQKGDALLRKLQAGAALPHRLVTHYFIFASIRLSQMLMPIETSTPTSAMPQIMR